MESARIGCLLFSPSVGGIYRRRRKPYLAVVESSMQLINTEKKDDLDGEMETNMKS